MLLVLAGRTIWIPYFGSSKPYVSIHMFPFNPCLSRFHNMFHQVSPANEPGLCSTSDWIFDDFCIVIFTTWMFILSQTNSVYFIWLLPTNWKATSKDFSEFPQLIQHGHPKIYPISTKSSWRNESPSEWNIWTILNSPVNHQIIRIFTWIFSDFPNMDSIGFIFCWVVTIDASPWIIPIITLKNKQTDVSGNSLGNNWLEMFNW